MAKLNIGSLVKISPHGFVDNFENNWFINNPLFTSLIVDDFENWFINNEFTKIMEDNFENDWFIDNIFSQLFTEDFEGDWA